ncbi:MAG: hypothetical protein IH934_03380 [Nanoarchaeota archaeon]|nr:hypothetical protein [Nanoarchaeota archaeon]
MNKKQRVRAQKIKSDNIDSVLGAVVLAILLGILLATPQEKSLNQNAQGLTVQETPNTEIKNIETEFGKKIDLRGLELTIDSADEKEYSVKELKTVNTNGLETLTFEKVPKTYEKIHITVFNPTSENKVFASIKLIDNLGNEYRADSNPDPNIELLEFGRDLIVSPSTLRRGYLFFLNVDERVEFLQLVFELESGEKKLFEFKWRTKKQNE